MKSLALLAVLALGSAWALEAKANPRGLGPSAIEAARLKAFPPGGYLSHYLPDDRYKIAGGVWKYVSTDLDTYYHVASSPNMMRQPADRVIGFSSVREAEEAGYTADPSDGTARQVEASRPVIVVPGSSGVAITGSTGDETRYLGRVIPLLLSSTKNATAITQRFSSTMRRSGPGQNAAVPAMMRQMTSQLLRQTRSTLVGVGRVRPPVRYRRFHSLLSQSLRDTNNLVFGLSRMTTTGNLGFLMQMQPQLQRAQVNERQLLQEANRLGIGAQLQQAMGLPGALTVGASPQSSTPGSNGMGSSSGSTSMP